MRFRCFLTALARLSFSGVIAAPDNLNFYTVWLMPQAPITLFQSTVIVPAGAVDPHIPGNVQAVWPGLQPLNGSAVLQNVVANQGNQSGEWFHLPFYCCTPAKQLGNSTQIYPGDELTSIFALDTNTHTHWSDIWFDVPGEIGTKAGLGPFSGSLSFDLKSYPVEGPYESSILAIELQGNSTWDFGPVAWTNIIVEAQTTNTDWCLKPSASTNLNYTYSTPTITTNKGSTVCRIESVVMRNPI